MYAHTQTNTDKHICQILGVVLCRTRSWTSLVPVGTFQLRIFYDSIVYRYIFKHLHLQFL